MARMTFEELREVPVGSSVYAVYFDKAIHVKIHVRQFVVEGVSDKAVGLRDARWHNSERTIEPNDKPTKTFEGLFRTQEEAYARVGELFDKANS